MPLHDWSRVRPGIYHGFHIGWIVATADRLTTLLPSGYYAYPEQTAGPFQGDVITLEEPDSEYLGAGGTALLTRPFVKVVQMADEEVPFPKRHLAVRRESDKGLVAVLELVSPGNKHSGKSIGAFVRKSRALIDDGVHLLIADPFPPSNRDPHGLHELIAEGNIDQPYALSAGERCAVSYDCGERLVAYLEPLAVGDVWPSMPVFLQPGAHILLPLEETYMTTWNKLPRQIRKEITDAAIRG